MNHEDERGSASIWVLCCAALVVASAALAMLRGSAVLVRHRTEAAADLAALAAASHIGIDQSGCSAARRIAQANGAVLASCSFAPAPSGRAGAVRVLVRMSVHFPIIGIRQVTARAEAERAVGRMVDVTFARLHHVQLAMPAGQEAAARAFFVDALGMTEIEKPPVLAARGGAWFRAGDVELHLGVEPDFRPSLKGHPGIEVTDIDDVVRRLAGCGQDVEWDELFPGFRRIYAHDPFGNRLEFLQSVTP